ncbi:hypothetical protein ABID97_003645 [Variovorax sp. OAS795]|uniref:DUF6876 family protein n=1 Tax=Variovorax sp. OAS795 TaxID=3034231 RepID=UPI0033923DA9
MKNGQDLLNELNQFHDSDLPYYHPLNHDVTYTPGVRHFAFNAGRGAYWLFDILATEPEILKAVRDLGIVFVRLTVKDSRAILVVNADDGEPPLFRRVIGYTDCPERPVTKDDPNGEWLFYLENMSLLLPGQR